MESRDASSQVHAHDALNEVARVRTKLARRVGAPWWYRWGLAAAVLAIFVGMGVAGMGTGTYENETLGISLVLVGGILTPIALLTALKNTTGVSIDRYAEGLSKWWLLLLALLILSFALQTFANVPYALMVGGAFAFVTAAVMERRINQMLNDRLTSDEQTERP